MAPGRCTRFPRRIALTLVLLAVGLSAPAARAREITVSGDGKHDFVHVQEALDAAVPGDVVRVLAGRYDEHLNLRTGVSLVGEGSAGLLNLPGHCAAIVV